MSAAGGTGCCAAGGCPPSGGPPSGGPDPPPLGGPNPPPPGGPNPSPGFFCLNAHCMAEAIFCDWDWVGTAVLKVIVVAGASSVVVVIVPSGNFVVAVSGLVFKMGSIGVCQICWSMVGSSVSLSWLSSSLSVSS